MMHKEYYIALGIIALCLSYIFFTNQQYLSIFGMAGIFALAVLAAFLFVIPSIYPRMIEKQVYLYASTLVLVSLGAYEYLFDLLPLGTFGTILHVSALIGIATIISVAGIYLIARWAYKQKGAKSQLVVFAGLVVVALLAYSVMYVVNHVQWNGVDEVGYNYYAAYLLVHGQNPYGVSMEPILAQRGIFPTVQLNGTYEFRYDYPALSFLAYLPIPLLGITSFFSFIFLVVLFTIIASYIVYCKSSGEKRILIPLAVWIVVSYALIGVATQYLAVSILLLLAYLYRSRPLVSGLALGLSASTIQLVWFALPFFYVLTYRKRGSKGMLAQVLATLAVFILINVYFLVSYPGAIRNIFDIFGLGSLTTYGSNIMQFAVAFYQLPAWYSAFISIISFAVLLSLYYVYTSTLRPIFVVVPMMIFFLSWRNISIYGLPFIPILLAVYASREKEPKDIVRGRLPIAICLAALVAIGMAVAILAHQAYASQPGIRIGSVLPILSVQQGYSGMQFSMIGLRILVNNTSSDNEPISFYIVSRSPNNSEYILRSTLNESMAHSISNYTVDFQLALVDNSTRIFVEAFSPDYTASKALNLMNLGKGISYP
ncbi:MAG: hypothetical protein KGH61_05345 [Candidatus Micrarchaeota archaeon]|nr:hypothetical protein [Candidatus Micrarchaeota archaeon]MDE1848339.1 hypothetical protein [Candidatus Micrarchaeota archaeon]MDE1864951.1 hypothetical protein [Candidatus Micrarchaeota archaeon]